MHNDIDRVLFSQDALRARVRELGEAVTADYAGQSLLVVGILRGACIFTADVVREIHLPIEMDFMALSSYASGAKSSGVVTIQKDIVSSIEGRHVLIVEDIVDSGTTLSWLFETLTKRNPASLAIMTLLRKKISNQVPVDCRYVGFECPDEFVVGYGLDYDQHYRNLPYIGVLKPEIYQRQN